MKKFIEDLKDPKKKSIIMLIGYATFFLFVFLVIATGKTFDNNDTYENYVDKTDKVEEKSDNIVNNYEYVYKIANNSKTIEIKGTKTSNKEIFYIDGIGYCKKGESVYLNDEVDCNEKTVSSNNTVSNDKIFNTDLYSYNNILNLLKDRIISESTKYGDNTIKDIYNINIKEYFDYMKEIDKCNNIDCSSINIDIIVNKSAKGQMEKVLIDLKNFYKHNYTVEISYENINNIKEISTNKE